MEIPQDYNHIDIEWLKNKQAEHGITQEKLGKVVCFDKFQISKLLNSKNRFPNDKKAAFYWFFKFLETQKNA